MRLPRSFQPFTEAPASAAERRRFFFSKENGEKRVAAFISREGVGRRPDVSGAG